MLAVDAAAELEAFSGFYGALYAREFWGDHVCCAAQPDEANGSPEDLVLAGIDEGAAETGRWAEQIVEAVSDRSSVNSLLSAIGTLAERLDIAPFARVVERRLLHGIMLGALDSEWEREHEEELKPATFAVEPGLPEGAFSNLPYADAVRLFNEKKVLPKSAFDTLEQGARRTAFTVARMASSEMLNVTKAELARMLNEGRQRPEVGPDGVARKPGANLRDFRKFAAARLESAGWTPANKSHVETIYRTNILTGYASGGFVEKRKPEVLAALPYWQIRGVRDSRARPTHKAAFGIVLRADHPFWKTAYPPFGYNCRCRIGARSVAWMKANGMKLGPVPTGLPDPGFDSGTNRLISVPDNLLDSPPPAPPGPDALPPLLPPLPLPPPPLLPTPEPPRLEPLPKPPPPLKKPPSAWLDNAERQGLAREQLRSSALMAARALDRNVPVTVHLPSGPVEGRVLTAARETTQTYVADLVPGAKSKDAVGSRMISAPGLAKSTGASGLHYFEGGQIVLDEEERAGAARALRAIAGGRHDAPFRNATAAAGDVKDLMSLQTVLHEEVHGFSRASPQSYTGIGTVLEEVGTELTSREALFKAAPGLDTPDLRGVFGFMGAYRREIEEVVDVISRHAGVSRDAAEKLIVHSHGKIMGSGPRFATARLHMAEFVAGLDLPPERAQLVMKDLAKLGQ
jgi:SPP1 gp7 family putative phage head morphogenesis protein